MAIDRIDIVRDGASPPHQENIAPTDPQIGFWSSPLFTESKRIFLKIKKEFHKFTYAASYILWGIRSVADVIDPKKRLLSKKFTHILFFASGFDFLLHPFNVVSVVKDVIALFSPKSLPAEIDAFLSVIRDAKYVVRDWATLLPILNTIKVVSKNAIRWIDKFNVICFFVDFISIEKECYDIKRCYTLLKKFEDDQAALQAQRLLKARAQVAATILQRIEREKEDIASDLTLSKKAIHARIEKLAHAILTRNKRKKSQSLREVNEFLKILGRRAKLEIGFSGIDLVNSIVYSAGSFIWFFPRFFYPSVVVCGFTGVVSVLMWASRKIVMKKNPF